MKKYIKWYSIVCNFVKDIIMKYYNIIQSLLLMVLNMIFSSRFKNWVKGLNFGAWDNWITSYTSLLWTKVESKTFTVDFYLKTHEGSEIVILAILPTILQFMVTVTAKWTLARGRKSFHTIILIYCVFKQSDVDIYLLS